MKRVLLTVLLAGTSFWGLYAQKLEKARSLLKSNKVPEAVKEIDNFLAIDKNASNADAWFTKSKIYLALSKTKEGAESTAAVETAEEAIFKYLDLQKDIKDSTKRNLLLLTENSQTLADIYSAYSQAGASFYNSNNFKEAYENFDKGLKVVDVMYENGLTDLALDTTGRLFAGISAEKANMKDEAAKQYAEIVKHKATGQDFDQIYKWVVEYYASKDDTENMFKIIEVGKEVFPDDNWWDLFLLEHHINNEEFEKVYSTFESLIAAKPDDYITKFNYAVTLYENNYMDNASQRPEGWEAKVIRVEELLKEVVQQQPDYVTAYYMLGQIEYNRGVDKNNENRDIRPEAGKRLTPEQTQQKDELRKLTSQHFDAATPYFEKVIELLEPQGKLKPQEKSALKAAYDFVILIQEDKLLQVETKQAEAETKKQTAVAKGFDPEIKALRAKIEELSVKYNEVDKKH